MSPRVWLRISASAGVVALASIARADFAPSDQYGLFNLNNDVISDQQTGLHWQRYASATTVTWAGTFGLCSSLSLDTYTTGWRVPSYKELLTLVDETPNTEYEGGGLEEKAIDTNAFPRTAIDYYYWSSSTLSGQTGTGYAVDFHTGVPILLDALKSGYVRCVHD